MPDRTSKVHGVTAAALVLIAAAAMAADVTTSSRLSRGDDLIYGGAAGQAAKTAMGTTMIMGPWGSGAPYNGQFESHGGAPAWNGWTSRDLTDSNPNHWHVDDFAFDTSMTYAPINGSFSAWCGSAFLPSCDDGVSDPDGGYGNDWNDMIEFRGTVEDNSRNCTLTITGSAVAHSEPGYDMTTLEVEKYQGFVELAEWDGFDPGLVIDESATYQPGDYVGEHGDEVVVVFRFDSDETWSDADCLYASGGAFILDDFMVTSDNGVSTDGVVDFEDGTLGPFAPRRPVGVGDFAKIWSSLDDAYDCASNLSPQVAFIDDGVVVPGTGGSNCITRCYGPGGFVVNTTGGLAGPDRHLHNAIESPVMAWPEGDLDGALISFDVYSHENLELNSPGIFYTWSVRSTADSDPDAIAAAPWRNRGRRYFGGPDYRQVSFPVGDLLVAGACSVQIQLAVIEAGWMTGHFGHDASPGPYFDNVRLTAYPNHGPTLIASKSLLPHDAFPESGELNLADLGANNVRFDMGRKIYGAPGDSVVIEIASTRQDAVVVGAPRLHWSLRRNPLFDPYRTAGLPDAGSVAGEQVHYGTGEPWDDRFSFDLPDSGFLFPGDILHYYFTATDEAAGEEQTAILPADTTGFSDFDDPMAFPPLWKVRALPSVTDLAGTQPEILFWDDAGDEGNRDEWYSAFANLGLIAGTDYDVYFTKGPRFNADHDQGLGGRATTDQLLGYRSMFYTSGAISNNTLDDSVLSPDVQTLTAWLERGGRNMFLTGADLAGDLARSGPTTTAFLHDWMGVDLVAENVASEIDGQSRPRVLPTADNAVFSAVDGWRATTDCALIISGLYELRESSAIWFTKQRIDGVVPRSGAEPLAEFLDPNGGTDAYPFSAATLHYRADFDARVISLPCDLQAVSTDNEAGSKAAASLGDRVLLLQDVLTFFGQAGSGAPSSVPWVDDFHAVNHPNPFNPATTISWNLPRAGRMGVKIYDVRGRVVRNLMDARQDAGPGKVDWDGTDTGGAQVASGVYFYEVRSGDQVQIGKMALIK